MIIPYNKISPKIANGVFIAPNATIIGDVEIGEDASIWFNTVVRGDVNYIRIGAKTNIQEWVTKILILPRECNTTYKSF